MTASFTTIGLTGERVLVRGTDQFGTAGEVVVDGSQWAEVNAHSQFDTAQAAFDQAVEEFFAPLMEATSKLEQASRPKAEDSVSYVVLHEAVEGVPAQAGHIVKLNKDSIVLRLIEQGNTDRLVWVAGELEILESGSTTPPAPQPSVTEDPAIDVPPSEGGVSYQ